MQQKIHVLVVTPAYSGKVHAQYAVALADTQLLLKSKGIDISFKISASGSLLVAERNRLTQAFMDSEATHMLCIDSDLGWPPEAVLKMLEADREFICGIYPVRGHNTFTFRPDLNPNGSIKQDKHLLKMEYVPAGFMLIKRSAIEKMQAKHKSDYFSPKHPQNPTGSGYCFFNTEVYEGEFWGEDYVFCRKATEAGVDIWADPLITFDHDGTVGVLTSVLTDKPPESEVTDVEAK